VIRLTSTHILALRKAVLASVLSVTGAAGLARYTHAGDDIKAPAPTDAVLAAEAERVATIERICRPTLAVFDSKGQGGGSGVLISADGYAITNFHVTAPCGPAMKCGLSDGRLVDAVLVGLDPGGDVALIKLLGDGKFPTAELGDSDAARAGDWVYVAGNPFLLADDFRPSVSYGIISGVHRYQYPSGTLLEYTDCLQTDAAVNPGNSGGPLFNADGQLIGINGRCSFEKRGRVNVGVGYAVSINQIKRFLSQLRSGRLVDHGALGATVSSNADHRAVVDDILEDSDVFRRGLRYGDELTSFANREISTANGLKNILGTYPEGWRVPIAFRRDGQLFERVTRLAASHREGELAELMESGPEKPGHDEHHPEQPQPDDKKPTPDRQTPPEKSEGKPHAKKAAELPAEVAKVYEPRTGYANYWFNRYHQERVWNSFLARGDFAAAGWNWTIHAKTEAGEDVEIQLSADHGSIVMPAGKSEAQFATSLGDSLGPPHSGGLLATLHLWQRLLLVGPRKFGEVYYFGTLPWPGQNEQPDCLVGLNGGVETHFYFDPTEGDLVGIEMQPADDQDPCEIYFGDIRPEDGRRLPHRMLIRHGDDKNADLTITGYEWKPTQGAGASAAKQN
jgi:S1-C subfamily serine protease